MEQPGIQEEEGEKKWPKSETVFFFSLSWIRVQKEKKKRNRQSHECFSTYIEAFKCITHITHFSERLLTSAMDIFRYIFSNSLLRMRMRIAVDCELRCSLQRSTHYVRFVFKIVQLKIYKWIWKYEAKEKKNEKNQMGGMP